MLVVLHMKRAEPETPADGPVSEAEPPARRPQRRPLPGEVAYHADQHRWLNEDGSIKCARVHPQELPACGVMRIVDRSHLRRKPSNEESISSPAVEVAAAQDKEQHDNVFNDPENESSPKPLRDPSTARPEGSSLWHKPRDPTASVSAAATVGSKTSKRPRLSE